MKLINRIKTYLERRSRKAKEREMRERIREEYRTHIADIIRKEYE